MKVRIAILLSLVALLFTTAGGLFGATTIEAAPHSEKVKQENKKAGSTGWKSKELAEFAQKQKAQRPTHKPKTKADEGGGQPSVNLAALGAYSAGPISGYFDEPSINVGQAIGLRVSTTRPSYTVELYRMGWYGGTGARLVANVGALAGKSQPVPAPDANGLVEAKWTLSYTFQTDASWVSGVYLAKLIDDVGNASYALFVLREDADQADVLYQVALSTYQAYNAWGGKSLYDYNSTGGRAYKVSFERPYDNWSGAGDFFDGDYNMIRWVESKGYSVKYATSIDLHTNAGLLANSKMFLSNWHDEYWSASMRANVTAARDAGKHLAFFDSNNVYWQIRYEASGTGRPNHTIVCYKDAALDPVAQTNPTMATVNWRDPRVNAPENGLLGVMFDGQFAFGSSYPWVVQNISHWIYQGTGLSEGAQIAGLVGYEYDKIFNNGATPAGLVILANSRVVNGNNATSTHNASIYTAPSGAIVFSAGTNYWSWKVDDNDYKAAGVDTRVQQMTANVIAKMTAAGTGSATATATPTATAVTSPTAAPSATTAPSTSSSYRQAVLDDRPLAYWRLGETSGTTMVDQNARFNGSYPGAPTFGVRGALVGDADTAARFNGTSAYGSIPYSATLNGPAFSLELWAYPTGGAGTYRGIAASRSYPKGWVLYAGGDDRWQLWLNSGTGMVVVDAGPVALNTWTHLVASFDGTTGRVYANGQLAGSGAVGSYGANTTNPMTIGQAEPGNGFWFPGVIDEASYYNVALGAAAVQSHYRAGLTASAPSATPTQTGVVTSTPTTTTPTTTPIATSTAVVTTTATATAVPTSPTATATATATRTATATATAADFSVAPSPTSRSVKRGRATTYKVTITPSGGFNGNVALSVAGLPNGTTASFAPSSLAVNGAATSSTLTVDTASSTPRGTYNLTVTASGGGKTRTSKVTLIVT